MIRYLTLILILPLLLLAASCGEPNATLPATEHDRLNIVASFHAVQTFVEAVAGDLADVRTIVPDGASAHGFEPKAQDLLKLADADLFVINGLGIEGWADAAVQAADNATLVVLDTSDGVSLIPLADEHDADEHEADHDHGEYDPHIWLGLTTAQKQVENIRDALIRLDPDNRSVYEQNTARLIASLDDLLNTYRPQFEAVPNRTIVTGHAAFAYLCRDFGLTQNSVQNVYADGEPSAMQLASLIEYSREHRVKTIFAEHLASPDVSRTLADEVGATIETIYTLEAAEGKKTYLERVETNLEKILAALQP